MLVMIDLDNTLVDREGAVGDWVAGFVASNGLGPAAAKWLIELDNDGYSSRVEVFAAIKERFELSPSVADLLAGYQRDIIELVRPLPDALTCLHDMRAYGWQIAIVTNGSTKQQNAKIDRLGFRDLVDSVVVSETLGIKKPDPGIFEHAAASCGVDPHRLGVEGTWMIGDSPTHDIAGAQALGISTGWLARGRCWPRDSPPPTLVVEDLDTLAGQLRSHGGEQTEPG